MFNNPTALLARRDSVPDSTTVLRLFIIIDRPAHSGFSSFSGKTVLLHMYHFYLALVLRIMSVESARASNIIDNSAPFVDNCTVLRKGNSIHKHGVCGPGRAWIDAKQCLAHSLGYPSENPPSRPDNMITASDDGDAPAQRRRRQRGLQPSLNQGIREPSIGRLVPF